MAGVLVSAVANDRSRLPGSVEKIVRSILVRCFVRGAVRHGRRLRLGVPCSVSSFHGLVIGKDVSVGQRAHIEVDGTIGDFCLIGRAVQIVGRADHALEEIGVPMAAATWVGNRPSTELDRVEIGRDVWIGGGAVILGGVMIGDGAVIGAGAVVSRNIEPFGIAVGNPAKVLRLRFSSDEERSEHLRRLSAG